MSSRHKCNILFSTTRIRFSGTRAPSEAGCLVFKRVVIAARGNSSDTYELSYRRTGSSGVVPRTFGIYVMTDVPANMFMPRLNEAAFRDISLGSRRLGAFRGLAYAVELHGAAQASQK